MIPKNNADYLDQYTRGMISDHQSEVSDINEWMENYDKQVEHEETLIEAIRNKPDEDGWVKMIPTRGKYVSLWMFPVNFNQLLITLLSRLQTTLATVACIRFGKAQ